MLYIIIMGIELGKSVIFHVADLKYSKHHGAPFPQNIFTIYNFRGVPTCIDAITSKNHGTRQKIAMCKSRHHFWPHCHV